MRSSKWPLFLLLCCMSAGAATASGSRLLTCGTTVTTYPYAESFESGLGAWVNITGDDMDWTRDSGGTPSSLTGPSSGADGSYYLYTEASGSNSPDKEAILEGPCFDLSAATSAVFSFQYHMYGSSMGTLRLELSSNGGGSWTTLWSKIGDQDNQWNSQEVNLNSYAGQTVQLHFYGITGSSWGSDMAIDDLEMEINTGSAGQVCTTTITSFPYMEGFESGFGDWTNLAGDDFDWTNQSGGTQSLGTGPTGAAEGAKYIYTESSSPNYPNKTAILESPCFDLSAYGSATLSFQYHMYGLTGMGQLFVETRVENETDWTLIWSRAGNHGTNWYTANVDISSFTGQTIAIRFRGVTSTHYQSDMAVDDVRVSVGTVPNPISCLATISSFPEQEGFESGWGDWTVTTPNNIWQLNSGSTPSLYTGPSGATEGTYYAYTEASNNFNQVAIIDGPCYDLTGFVSAGFDFYYHMWGGDMGSLRLELKTDNDPVWTTVWEKVGDQGNNWLHAWVDLDFYVGQTIQLRFYAVTGDFFESDMAIDNLVLYAQEEALAANLTGIVEFPFTTTCPDTTQVQCCDPGLSAGAVPNVGMEITPEASGSTVTLLTDASGVFSSEVLGGNISIVPVAYSSDWNNGVTAFDLMDIDKHINGTAHIDCPLRRLAADVDNDGDIDANDRSLINQLILTSITSFPAVDNWRLVPKAYITPGDLNPDQRFTADFWNAAAEDYSGNEYPFKATLKANGVQYTYNGTDSWIKDLDWAWDPDCDYTNWGFYIVKSGDVSGSANYSTLQSPYTANAEVAPASAPTTVSQVQSFLNEDGRPRRPFAKNARANKKYEVSVIAHTDALIQGYQLGIQFDDEILNLEKIKPNKEILKQTETGNYGQSRNALRGGNIKTVWINDFSENRIGRSMRNGIMLFSFELKSELDLDRIKSAIRLDNGILVNEFYGREGRIDDVDLQIIIEPAR